MRGAYRTTCLLSWRWFPERNMEDLPTAGRERHPKSIPAVRVLDENGILRQIPGMQLTGFHHLTAVTADAARNHDFYTETLGLRLVKKTVNQDDVSAYHLFYADGAASPGTDMTFFDWPVGRERRGTNSIVRTGFRVRSVETLRWWQHRFESKAVASGRIAERDGRPTLDFEDFEGQRLSLVVDQPSEAAHPWDKSSVPAGHQLLGLGPITISVPDLRVTDMVLTKVMNMRRVRE